MRKHMGNFFAKSVVIIGILCLFTLILANLLFAAQVDVKEKVSFEMEKGGYLYSAAAVIFSMFFGSKWAEKIEEKKLFRICAVGYLLCGTYLILSVNDVIRADSFAVFGNAQLILNGNYSGFEAGGYLSVHPQQIGLLLYDLLLELFSYSPRVLFFANLIWVLVINRYLWKISNLLFSGNKAINISTILLSFLFLPQFFFILFAYNTIPGLVCFTAGCYYILEYTLGPSRAKSMLLGGLLVNLAVAIRSNYQIGLIAILLYEIVLFLQKKAWKYLWLCGVLMAAFLSLQWAMKQWVVLLIGQTPPEGMPAFLWIAMGTDPQNQNVCGPGWFNGYPDRLFEACGYNGELAGKIALEQIRENFLFFYTHPEQAVKFFGKKFISTWCEPTYQSIWSGPLARYGQETYTYITSNIYNQKGLYWFIRLFSKGVTVTILLFTFLYSLDKRKAFSQYGLLILYLIGGVLFHLMWETKSQYVYGYVFLLIPLGAAGAFETYQKMIKKWRESSWCKKIIRKFHQISCKTFGKVL